MVPEGLGRNQDSAVMTDFLEAIDIFFNGRPANAKTKQSAVTVTELIKCKKSVVLHAGKLYRITCEEVSVEKAKESK